MAIIQKFLLLLLALITLLQVVGAILAIQNRARVQEVPVVNAVVERQLSGAVVCEGVGCLEGLELKPAER